MDEHKQARRWWYLWFNAPNMSSGCLNRACKCFLMREVNPALITAAAAAAAVPPSPPRNVKQSPIFSRSTLHRQFFARGASWFVRLAVFQSFNLPIAVWSRRCSWERALPRSLAEHESRPVRPPRGEGEPSPPAAKAFLKLAKCRCGLQGISPSCEGIITGGNSLNRQNLKQAHVCGVILNL